MKQAILTRVSSAEFQMTENLSFRAMEKCEFAKTWSFTGPQELKAEAPFLKRCTPMPTSYSENAWLNRATLIFPEAPRGTAEEERDFKSQSIEQGFAGKESCDLSWCYPLTIRKKLYIYRGAETICLPPWPNQTPRFGPCLQVLQRKRFMQLSEQYASIVQRQKSSQVESTASGNPKTKRG